MMESLLRQDIQFLRGWAVIIVVLQHAGIGPSAGYLGVDIFFVISGYLITRLIEKQLVSGTFSFAEFYTRRAKRLLPAAYVTFALTTIIAPYFLSNIQLVDFYQQLMGALTFSANMVLYGQSGYFDGEAELKPLLHIWSLSLEEQYYFVLPLLLFLIRRRFWTHIKLAALFSSIGLCTYYLLKDPSLAFYSLPTRAWELCIGSLVALSKWDNHTPKQIRWAFWPAAALVIFVPFFPLNLPHPSAGSALVCLGTAVLILCGRSFSPKVYPLRMVAWIGDASYSIYLVHWPIISFQNNAYLSEVPLQARYIALALSFFLGLALYYSIERPIHKTHIRLSPIRSVLATLFVGLCIFAIPDIKKVSVEDTLDFAKIRRPNFGLAKECDQGTSVFKPLDACRSHHDKEPKVALWGDSLAMHLAQGLTTQPELSLIQATRSSCPPAIGYAQFNDTSKYNEVWAHNCVEFNRSVLNYLTSTESIDTVIIGSTFFAFNLKYPWNAIIYGRGREFKKVEITKQRSVQILTNTVKILRKAGKRVVIFAPPPADKINYSECIERTMSELITFGMPNCSIPLKSDKLRYGEIMDILSALSSQADIEIINPRDWMCDKKSCQTIINNIPLYRDAIHLSEVGSTYLGREHNWAMLVNKLAR